MPSSLALAALAIASGGGLGGGGDAMGSKPHLISILQDDLGYYDSGVHNDAAANWTTNITRLAKSGIVLTNHYSHWHCSPSRRSFLTGRLPIHHGEQLSGDTTDDIDLRMTWISQKLQSVGYSAHMFGKFHTGFRSMRHLPVNRGFATATGSLQTGGAYQGPAHSLRWQDDHPIVKDNFLTDPPDGCDVYASEATTCSDGCHSELPMCSPGVFLNHTELPCGTGTPLFFNSTTAAECCGACASTAGCTHWVYNKGEHSRPPCHVKFGGVRAKCHEHSSGSTSGLAPPSPPANTTCTNEYSTDLWGQLAVQVLKEHPPSVPLYLHLCFEAVHTPYDPVPDKPADLTTYQGMVWRADVYVGALVHLLEAKGMLNRTLIVYSSDNGGVEHGINYPLRGEKHSNWDGGMRTAAFVSGGLVPLTLRGTTNGVNMHLVDWYATFCGLAGVVAADDPPEAPLKPTSSEPFRNIYGEHSYPPLDGVDLWPLLTDPHAHSSPSSAHTHLVLSKEVLIAGRWKLLVSQPYFKSQNNGWKGRDGVWRQPNATERPSCMYQDGPPTDSLLPVPSSGGAPCLFDLRADPGEHVDLADTEPNVVLELWAALNTSALTQRDCSGWSYEGIAHAAIPGPTQPDGTTSCSPPTLIGHCDAACAKAHWHTFGDSGGKGQGPICGVPGC